MEGMLCPYSLDTGVGPCEEGGRAGDMTAWSKGRQYLYLKAMVPFGTIPSLYPRACLPS